MSKTQRLFNTYSVFAASVQEGIQLISAIQLLLGCRESNGLGQVADESHLVALGSATVGSAAAQDGALEWGLVVHPPEGRVAGQIASHIPDIVQVADVRLHQHTADQQQAN